MNEISEAYKTDYSARNIIFPGNVENINNDGGNYHVITKIVFLPMPITLSDIFPFVLTLFVYALFVQFLLAIWKKLHGASYKILQVFLVLSFPFFLFYFTGDYIILGFWMFYICLIVFCMMKIHMSHMTYKIPKRIFKIFKNIFFITNIAMLLGHLFIFLSFFVFISTVKYSFRFFIYSVYISVLSREIILNLSHIMVSKSGYFSKEGCPSISDTTGLCMICTENFSEKHSIISLQCNHSYHEECIRGWSIIGQNNFCPYCKNGIDKAFFKLDFWDKIDLPFKPLMNFVRSSILFLIILCLYLTYSATRVK